jgi:hypothetical protein
VYENFVQNERQMEFKPKPTANCMSWELNRDEDQADHADPNCDDVLTSEKASVVWKLPHHPACGSAPGAVHRR